MASDETGNFGQEIIRLPLKLMSQMSQVSQQNYYYPDREATKPPFSNSRKKYHDH